MRILCTNDDGIFARGLSVLERVAARFGEVITVAPDRERSAVSHAITLHAPLRVREMSSGRFIVDGTPTDCIWLALNHILADRPPDVVLSGINHGPNVGHDVLYSGTVAGAAEGALQDLPAMALSFIGYPDYPFEKIEGIVGELLERFLEHPPPPRCVLNVNIPNPGEAGIRGLRPTSLGMRYYSKEVVERQDPRGRGYVWIGGAEITTEDIEGSDCNALREGYVSITPVSFDLTHPTALAGMERWHHDSNPGSDDA